MKKQTGQTVIRAFLARCFGLPAQTRANNRRKSSLRKQPRRCVASAAVIVLLACGVVPNVSAQANMDIVGRKEGLQQSTAAVVGANRILVVPVSYLDSAPGDAPTPAYLMPWISYATEYYRIHSAGQLHLEWTIADLVQLSRAADGYSSMQEVSDEALATARQRSATWDPDNYNYWIVWGGANDPWLGASAYIGMKGLWIGRAPNQVAHELGHNFGLGHAGGLLPNTSDAFRGIHNEYADVSDLMGAQPVFQNPKAQPLNALFKRRLGWLPDSAVQSVSRNINGLIINRHDSEQSAGVRLIIVQWQGQPLYYLECRRLAFLFDDPDTAPVGVQVRKVYADDYGLWSQLLDTRPLTVRDSWYDLQDGGMQAGAVFHDYEKGIRVQVTGVTSNHAAVNIKFGDHSLSGPVVERMSDPPVMLPHRGDYAGVIGTGSLLGYQWVGRHAGGQTEAVPDGTNAWTFVEPGWSFVAYHCVLSNQLGVATSPEVIPTRLYQLRLALRGAGNGWLDFHIEGGTPPYVLEWCDDLTGGNWSESWRPSNDSFSTADVLYYPQKFYRVFGVPR